MEYIVIGIILLVVVAIAIAGIRIVRPVEKGLIENLGKYSGTAEPGFKWIIPVIQKMIKVNITEIRVDIEPQSIITNDKLNVNVDAVVYYKIKDCKKAIYEVNEFEESVPSLARTTLRAVVGKMSLADANEKRDEINHKVEEMLDKQTNDWGIDIIRVEIQEITPPRDVQDAMNQVVKAENEKISAVNFATATETKADGEKRAKIKEAEGKKEALVLTAEGERESKILIAEGQKKAFELIEKSFVGNAQELKRLEVLQASLEHNAKIVLTKEGISPNIIMDAIPVKKK